MIRCLSFGFLLFVGWTTVSHAAPLVPPPKPPTLEKVNEDLLAKAALLMDPLTGQVIYARNIDDTFPPRAPSN